MTNKLLLSTLIASSLLLSSQANAVDGLGTAKIKLVTPISVSESIQMEFGNIDSVNDDFCNIDTAGALTGGSCIPGGAAAAAGEFNIAATDGTVNLAVAASGAPVPGVTFEPKLDTPTQIVSGNAAVVKVGGKVTIVGADATDGAKNLGYTLSVTY